MADDLNHQTDIDDVMREAEQQLEAKLDALRQSALGATATHDMGDASGEAAELRPTGIVSSSNEVDEWDVEWDAETSWDAPVEPISTPAHFSPEAVEASGTETYPVDELDEPWGFESGSRAGDAEWEPATFDPDGRAGASLSDREVDEQASSEPLLPAIDSEPLASAAFDTPVGYVHTEPVASRSSNVPVVDDEFQAQTRVALRKIQQMTETLSTDVAEQVSSQMVDAIRDEMATPTATLRLIQQQSISLSDRIEHSVGVGIPDELDRIKRDLAATMRVATNELTQQVHGHLAHMGEQLDSNIQEVSRTVREDVVNAEQSVNQNLARSTQGFGAQLGRVERGVQSGIERIEQQLESGMRLVGSAVSEELAVPMAAMSQLQEEMPTRFGRIERIVQEESSREELERLQHELRTWQNEQRELGDALRTELDANGRQVRQLQTVYTEGTSDLLTELRSQGSDAIERLDAITAQMDRDRTQRAEDLELLVDSMTRGWKGVYTAVNRLLERVEGVDSRITVFERKLAAFDSLDTAVESTLAQVRAELDAGLRRMSKRLDELKPSPVVVTVQSPDATVTQP